jgi:hypothetical protein
MENRGPRWRKRQHLQNKVSSGPAILDYIVFSHNPLIAVGGTRTAKVGSLVSSEGCPGISYRIDGMD